MYSVLYSQYSRSETLRDTRDIRDIRHQGCRATRNTRNHGRGRCRWLPCETCSPRLKTRRTTAGSTGSTPSHLSPFHSCSCAWPSTVTLLDMPDQDVSRYEYAIRVCHTTRNTQQALSTLPTHVTKDIHPQRMPQRILVHKGYSSTKDTTKDSLPCAYSTKHSTLSL